MLSITCEMEYILIDMYRWSDWHSRLPRISTGMFISR